MVRWLVILGTVLGVFFCFIAGYFWWEARRLRRKVTKERADHVRQDISDNYERIKEDLLKEDDQDKWKELDDRIETLRRH